MRRTIASENRVGSGGGQFPKIKFQGKGERKRLLLIDQDGPWQEYIHYIKEPVLIDGVRPKMQTRTRPRSDEEYEDYETELISMALCFGEAGVIEEQGYDAKNCPACAEVREAPAEARLVPVLRFAANVVDYVLKPGSWNVQKPFSASVKIWNFTASVYDELVSLAEQNGTLIREKDLTLECTNPFFNQAKLGVMPVTGWQELGAGAQLGQLLAEEGNVATDEQLKDSCGRVVKRAYMEKDVETALRKWAKAIAWNENGGLVTAGVTLGGGQSPQTLDQGVSALLGGSNGASPQEQVEAARAQVQRDFAAVGAGPHGPDLAGGGLGEFTPEGTSNPATPPAQPPAQNAAPSPAPGTAPQPPAAADPFAVLGGGAAPAAAQGSPFAQNEPAAPASPEPAASPQAAPPSEEKKVSSFDALVAGLGG